jgi:hypothetical protein
MHGDVNQLLHLKDLLLSFAEFSGLVNFTKSCMVPINIPDEKMQILADTFQCSIASLPFTYLGLPLSISRPTVADFWPLVSKCERRLVAFSSYLSDAGRLELTNAVLSAFPTYTMCTFLLPKSVLKQIDKYRKHCLWRGSDLNNKKPSKAAWPQVCLPKEKGGLGVIDLNAQNKSLLMKQLHKFSNRYNVPWVQLVWDHHFTMGKLPFSGRVFKGSFWWRDVLKLLTLFKEIATPLLNNGTSCLLWYDNWNGQPWNQRYPQLFSYAKNKLISANVAASTPLLQDLFSLPLSNEAYLQFQQISSTLQSLPLGPSNDVWSFLWGSSLCQSRKVYKFLIGHRQVHAAYKWLWRSSCQNKRKFFFWLVLKDRLSTRGLLRRRNMHLPDFTCVFCNLNIEEDLLHLLFHCPFAMTCWYSLNLIIPNSDDILIILEGLKIQIRLSFLWKSLSPCAELFG